MSVNWNFFVKKTDMKRVLFCSVLLLGFMLLFLNLGDRYLRLDEAETALLARNVLKYGYPRAWDGRNLITQQGGRDYNEDYAWTWHPWLQFYIAAISMNFFGYNQLAARLPFTIFGFLSIILAFQLSKEVYGDYWKALISMALIVSSVPFLIHVRQARYYPLSIFFTLLCMITYVRFINKKSSTTKPLTLSLILLLSSDLVAFAGVLLTLVLSSTINKKIKDKRIYTPILVSLTFAIGWMLYSNHNLENPLETVFLRIILNYIAYLPVVMYNIIPPIFIAAYIIQVGTNNRSLSLNGTGYILLTTVFSMILVASIAASHVDQIYFRYIISILPLIMILMASYLTDMLKKRRLLFCIILMLLILTNFLHIMPSYFLDEVDLRYTQLYSVYLTYPREPGYPLFSYIHEITHHVEDSIECISEELSKSAEETDIVKISYEDLPLMFHTNLTVVYRGNFYEDVDADWIIPLDFNVEYMKLRGMTEGFNKTVLNCVDAIPFSNDPEPSLHSYRTPLDGPRVKIYHKD